MKEELKDIPGYQGIYAASRSGHIWSYKLNRYIAESLDPCGYKKVHLITDKSRTQMVHRLIALAWIPNPQDKPTVDHIDRNTFNNNVQNLRWATYSEQAKNREWTYARQIVAEMGAKANSKPVQMRDKENHSILLKTFDSSMQAAIQMFNDPKKNSLINRCANGKKKSAYGYFWCFKKQ